MPTRPEKPNKRRTRGKNINFHLCRCPKFSPLFGARNIIIMRRSAWTSPLFTNNDTHIARGAEGVRGTTLGRNKIQIDAEPFFPDPDYRAANMFFASINRLREFVSFKRLRSNGPAPMAKRQFYWLFFFRMKVVYTPDNGPSQMMHRSSSMTNQVPMPY